MNLYGHDELLFLKKYEKTQQKKNFKKKKNYIWPYDGHLDISSCWYLGYVVPSAWYSSTSRCFDIVPVLHGTKFLKNQSRLCKSHREKL